MPDTVPVSTESFGNDTISDNTIAGYVAADAALQIDGIVRAHFKINGNNVGVATPGT